MSEDTPELYVNGVKMNSEEEFTEALNEAQEYMIATEAAIESEFGVSGNTAAAIQYLRSRSRWTQEKEQELINRDRAGNPISLGKVLSGEF